MIYIEVLVELRDRPSGPTRLSRATNLSFDKCVEVLGELEAKGLVRKDSVDGHDTYGATQTGSELINDWNRVWERLRP